MHMLLKYSLAEVSPKFAMGEVLFLYIYKSQFIFGFSQKEYLFN